MSTTISLPASLRARLTALRWRIRLLRAVGGFALLVVIVSFLAASAMLADYWLDLPTQTRQVVLVTWLAVAIGWLLRGVIIPLCRRIDAAALAAVIEVRYPTLGERLSSTVELADVSVEGHGSPLLIALLLEETAVRSEPLDFLSAVPARRTAILTTLAAATLLLLAAPVMFWPQQYQELAQRFFRPWDIAPIEAPVDIAETPSAPAITPVELAADSPIITITPPVYARSVKQTETFHGLVDLVPLQYSEIHFDFRFTRPAVAAYLEWTTATGTCQRPSGSNRGVDTSRSPLTLSADRRAASLAIPAFRDGKYRLILEAEQNVRTELPGGTIHVQIDQPPTVQRFTGKTESRSVLPYERLPFEIEAADDIGVAGIELEYRVNDGETIRQPLEFAGTGGTGVSPVRPDSGTGVSPVVARHVLELVGKVQENDHFSYRFRVSDNLPKEYKGPHVIFYPPDKWLTLRIVRQGDTLEQKEILAQRDEINRRLKAIRESLQQEKRDVERVKQELRRQEPLPPDPLDSTKQLQRENQDNQKSLREAAELAEATPELQRVAELARDVANREMDKSQQALEQTSRQTSPTERERQFRAADKQLDSAIKRLEELKKTNDRLAQERLNQAKLEMLAQRENHLAEQAAELLGKHPVLDPKARELAEKLKREQAEATGELERLAQQSEPLKQSLQQAQQEEARKLAQRARELARAQRDLARAEEESKRKRTKDRYAELARKQQELAKQQEELARKTRSSAPAAHTEPLKPEKAQRAAEALKKEKAAEAIPQQDQAANDLERLAQAFEQAANAPTNPKKEAPQRQQFKEQSEQARQWARRQRELREDVQRALEAARSERPTAEQRDQQRHLQEKTGELSRQFQRLSQEARSSWPMQAALQRASGESQQAQQTMQYARDQGQRGEAPAEKQTQERAAQLLDQAARAASEASRPQQSAKSNAGDPKSGEAVAKAGRQMAEAQGQLQRGQAAQAQSAMQQAARALGQAAQQMAANPARQPGMPARQVGLGRQAGGLPDLSAYGVDKAAYAGKSWGELPGELRTKIVQDIKARYGEDYARMIKSYFEQIADTKKK